MADLLRISVTGTMPNGEEWSVNPCFALNDFPVSTSPAQVAAVAQAAALITVQPGLRAAWAQNTQHTGVRVEARTKAGVLENQAEAVRSVPSVGTGANVHPFQTAWVTSLRTAHVGASGRGRLYWPGGGVPLDIDSYRPTDALTASTLTAVKTYMSDLQTAVRLTFGTAVLAVWSRKLQILYPVNQLQMGNILDTQRRRRDALVETYTSVAYP